MNATPRAEASAVPPRDPSGAAPTAIDYDLHGIVGVRLVDATSADARAVDRQLGPIRKPLDRMPDITIRFVDALPIAGTVRLLGLDEAGYTDDAFLVLRGKHKTRARVQIRFEKIGGRCEITCESGLAAVPLLIPILNLTALANGALPLHASAFEYEGTGILTTGWSKGGKTEALLTFMARGARYIGDEWVYLDRNAAGGTRMSGIPEPIRMWDWHLEQLPAFRGRVKHADRVRLRFLRSVLATSAWMSNAPGASLPHARVLRRLQPLLKRQTHVDMHPEKLFGPIGSASGTLDKIFFVGSHESPAVTVQPIGPDEIARRMVYSLQFERLPFLSWYYTFCFAFPHLRNELLDEAESLQRQRLLDLLGSTEAHRLDHPYPVAFDALFDAIRSRL